MEAIFVLLPLALLIAAIAVCFFIWAARTGQFDDLETPALRILFDDEEPRATSSPGATAMSPAAPGTSTHSRPSTTVDPTRRVRE